MLVLKIKCKCRVSKFRYIIYGCSEGSGAGALSLLS